VDKTSGGAVIRTVTYYPVAGAMRINSTLYYILKDHLGSASVVTNSSGVAVGEQRYYPYGETRLSTGTIYTDRLFTGQREITSLGIYHYGARFYSTKLGRFLSADSIVPGAANPQAWNRYSYVLGNPLKYIDPTGHVPQIGIIFESDGPLPLASYGIKVEGKLSSNALLAVSKSIRDIAKALGKANGKDAVSSFKEEFSGGVTVRKWPSDKCRCAAEVSQDGAGYELRIYQDQWAGNHPDLFIHEFGHIYYNLHKKEFTPMGSSLRRPDYGNAENGYHGFSGGKFNGQYAVVNLDSETEIFADMFLGWVHDEWTLNAPGHPGEARKDWMSVNMAGS
jgi:RHS repeat-associated protein